MPEGYSNVCDVCELTAPVLASFYDPERGPFAEPAGHACFGCRPDAFDAMARTLMKDFGPAKPGRVRLSRKRDHRIPKNTVVVARPSKYGNPFTMASYRAMERDLCMPPAPDAEVRAELVHAFRNVLRLGPDSGYWQPDNCVAVLGILKALDAGELRGKNLACWCPLDQPCHADVLLELANGSEQ